MWLRNYQAVISKLEDLEKAVAESTSHPLQSILLSEPDGMVTERLGSLSVMSPERLSNLASILLDYRLLDVCAFIKPGLSLCGQPNRLPIPLPPKMVRSCN